MGAELVLRQNVGIDRGIPPVPLVPPWTFTDLHEDAPAATARRAAELLDPTMVAE